MAKHWSREVYVLCWKDKTGRKRMSWDTDCDKLALYAAALDWEGAEPAMYNGFGKEVPFLRPTPRRKSKPRTRKGKQLSADSDPAPTAA